MSKTKSLRFLLGQLVSVVNKEGDLKEVRMVDRDNDNLHAFDTRGDF
jgi:hypothetical protein